MISSKLITATNFNHILKDTYKKQVNYSVMCVIKMQWCLFYNSTWGFPGGAVVKNPPANAGDAGSGPGPGRSHMLQSN